VAAGAGINLQNCIHNRKFNLKAVLFYDFSLLFRCFEDPFMKNTGLSHPLAAARAAAMLEAELQALKLAVHVSSDMKAFDVTKQRVRGIPVAPMHHHDVGVFQRERAFWMYLTDESGETVGLQAFRYDEVDTHLADWCVNYMIGVYMRQNEVLVPSFPKPPEGSFSEKLTGKLVYHGEIWITKNIKNRKVFEVFVRLGLILAVIKWRPDAIWGLASAQMAGHGHFTRVGYTILERGFLRWQWASEGIDPVEYLVAAELSSLEAMIDEMMSTEAESAPVPAQKPPARVSVQPANQAG
jgi:hypothetical protein